MTRLKKLINKPKWIKSLIPSGKDYINLKKLTKQNNLHTVCEEARCPNLGECWSKGTLTFMILGDTCTRSCGFCAVKTGFGGSIDHLEPKRLAKGIENLKLNNNNIEHLVITSVNRDDKNIESAHIFSQSIKEIRKLNLDLDIEALIPDFLGKKEAYDLIIESNPDVLNHNIETVNRLYRYKQSTGVDKDRAVRPQADYQRSLKLLKYFSENSKIVTKSGIMIGLGESCDEIRECIRDLSFSGCKIINIGQYLQPTPEHIKVKKYYSLQEFEEFKEYAEENTNIIIADCGPMVRSSFRAESQLFSLRERIEKI